MKVKHIFNENDAQQLRNWEASRPDYPPEWDKEEFEPSDHGFEPFTEVWGDIQKFLRNGNNLPAIAAAVGIHPQQLFASFRKEKRHAVDSAREQFSNEDLDDVFYTDDAMSVMRTLNRLIQSPNPNKKANAQTLNKAMAELTDERNLYNHEAAEKRYLDKHSDF